MVGMEWMPISQHIWQTKYRSTQPGPIDQGIEASWTRIAKSLAAIESDKTNWEKKFFDLLSGFKFLPGGRIQAGAGTQKHVTLFNCFVMGKLEDSMTGIFDGLKEGALTMQQGGGVGYDFSPLRHRGEPAHHTGTIASGPVSFMRIWDSMCATILSTGARRGAMMATLRCDHPDIFEFVTAKSKKGELTHFNLSVLVTDKFMTAVKNDSGWDLCFPIGHVVKTVKARELWDTILKQTYHFAEPGVLFIDRINRENNLWYCEEISATNPCGEIPLPPYGACNLGSFNLTAFIKNAFDSNASMDWIELEKNTEVAVRLLDNVISISQFPLPQQKKTEHSNRRIGIGLTGLADALHMMGIAYDSNEGRAFAEKAMQTIRDRAYLASTDLASERGSFPEYNAEKYLKGPFIQKLPQEIQVAIKSKGIRNSHLISIAPTGTISLLANNISSGIEPVFDYYHRRKILNLKSELETFDVWNFSAKAWKDKSGSQDYPKHFRKALELDPKEHLAMQASIQPYVDNAISKTINIPEDYSFEKFKTVYDLAYDRGLKGVTTFRPNSVTGSILEESKK